MHPCCQSATRFSYCTVKSLTVGILVALCSLPSMADIFYKWRDANGVWVYGANPPAGVQVHIVKTSSGKVSAKKQPASSGQDEEEGKSTSDPDEPQELIVEKQLSKKERKALCESATKNLEVLNSKDIIRKRDADGNVTLLTDEEKQTQIERAKLAKEKHC